MPHRPDFFSQPQQLGGQLTRMSSLSAFSWGPNRIDVFGTGSDFSLQHWWFDNGWGNNAYPEDLGGGDKLALALNANTYRPGSLEIFAGYNDNSLQHWWCLDDTWLPRYHPENFGHPFGPPVTTVSRGYNRLDVFSCAHDGQLVWWFRE